MSGKYVAARRGQLNRYILSNHQCDSIWWIPLSTSLAATYFFSPAAGEKEASRPEAESELESALIIYYYAFVQVDVTYVNGRFREISTGSVARFVFAIFVALAAVATTNVISLGLLLIISLYSFWVWGGNFGQLTTAARYLIWLLAFVFVLHLFINPGRIIFTFWFLHATIDGAKAGVLYGFKLLVFTISAYIIFLTTDAIELISPMERLAKILGRHGKLISSLALAFFLALRFLPELSEQARMTILAFKSKGLDLNGGLRHKARIISLILPPLFVNAFKRSEVTAAALNVKGYATRYI